jgi:hypothetical protein
MSTIELKNILISKIAEINDEAFLIALNTIIESKTRDVIILSQEQKLAIKNSQKEYLEGQFHTNDSVNEEMEKWLQEE